MVKEFTKQSGNTNLRRGNPAWGKKVDGTGKSGNGGVGRPRKMASLTSQLREDLMKPCPYAPDKTWLQYLVERWLAMASENSMYFKELLERLEGKVAQPLIADLTTKGKALGNGHIDIPEQHFADALVILAKSGISQN